MEEKTHDHGEDDHNRNIMKGSMLDDMPLEKDDEPEPVEKPVGDYVEIRGVGDKDDDPGGVPSGVPEKEHPGDNRNRSGVHKVLCQYSLTNCLKKFI